MWCRARCTGWQAGGGGRPHRARSVQRREIDCRLGGRAREGAHSEHVLHVCDTGGDPVRYVRVEVLQALEEVAHVSDGRGVPFGDGAVRCNGAIRVRIKGLDRRLQLGLARKDVIEQAAAACGRRRRGRRRGWRERRRERRRRRGQEHRQPLRRASNAADGRSRFRAGLARGVRVVGLVHNDCFCRIATNIAVLVDGPSAGTKVDDLR